MPDIFSPIEDIAKELKYGDIVVKFEIRQGKVFKARVLDQNKQWTQQDIDKSNETEVRLG